MDSTQIKNYDYKRFYKSLKDPSYSSDSESSSDESGKTKDIAQKRRDTGDSTSEIENLVDKLSPKDAELLLKYCNEYVRDCMSIKNSKRLLKSYCDDPFGEKETGEMVITYVTSIENDKATRKAAKEVMLSIYGKEYKKLFNFLYQEINDNEDVNRLIEKLLGGDNNEEDDNKIVIEYTDEMSDEEEMDDSDEENENISLRESDDVMSDEEKMSNSDGEEEMNDSDEGKNEDDERRTQEEAPWRASLVDDHDEILSYEEIKKVPEIVAIFEQLTPIKILKEKITEGNGQSETISDTNKSMNSQLESFEKYLVKFQELIVNEDLPSQLNKWREEHVQKLGNFANDQEKKNPQEQKLPEHSSELGHAELMDESKAEPDQPRPWHEYFKLEISVSSLEQRIKKTEAILKDAFGVSPSHHDWIKFLLKVFDSTQYTKLKKDLKQFNKEWTQLGAQTNLHFDINRKKTKNIIKNINSSDLSTIEINNTDKGLHNSAINLRDKSRELVTRINKICLEDLTSCLDACGSNDTLTHKIDINKLKEVNKSMMNYLAVHLEVYGRILPYEQAIEDIENRIQTLIKQKYSNRPADS